MSTDKATNWKQIDPATLPQEQQKLYAAYKAAYKVQSDARKAFESAVNDSASKVLPAGKCIVFGYKFGKLAMAVGDVRTTSSAGKGAVSVADFVSSSTLIAKAA